MPTPKADHADFFLDHGRLRRHGFAWLTWVNGDVEGDAAVEFLRIGRTVSGVTGVLRRRPRRGEFRSAGMPWNEQGGGDSLGAGLGLSSTLCSSLPVRSVWPEMWTVANAAWLVCSVALVKAHVKVGFDSFEGGELAHGELGGVEVEVDDLCVRGRIAELCEAAGGGSKARDQRDMVGFPVFGDLILRDAVGGRVSLSG